MTSFRPDHRGVGALAASRGVGAACVAAGEAGQTFAEGIAPRDSGEYARSFRVRRQTVQVVGRNPRVRAGAVLENTARHAAAVEWGNGDHVLGRSVDAIERS